MQNVKVASRGSRLALTQSQQVIDQLAENHPQVNFEIIELKTHGDQGDLSVTGAFTNVIEQALVNQNADIAIHSFKDLPTQIHQDLTIAAVPKRVDAKDVFISNKYNNLLDVPNSAIIGTGSPRRKAQLQSINPNWQINFINGNIDTRIQKLNSEKYDAIILAAAGLIRMDWQNKITQSIAIDTMIPAPAQGALAIQCRNVDAEIKAICRSIHCENTGLAVSTERKILSGIGGGCQLPIGAFVVIDNHQFTLDALFGILPNKQLNKIQLQGGLTEIEPLCAQAIKQLTTNQIIT